ncbi:MAG: hypothetical protein JNG82_11625 [Opitutaceae bacterium]|jgi:hypothetical protein|nr:hypothetical protein [Opitutaceae bacterium]
MPVDTATAQEAVPLDRERDRPHPLQIELYRRATPTQKLAVVARLRATALGLKEAALLRQFPDQSLAERRRMLRRWWLAARD